MKQHLVYNKTSFKIKVFLFLNFSNIILIHLKEPNPLHSY